MVLYASYVCLLHSCFVENHPVDLEATNPSFLWWFCHNTTKYGKTNNTDFPNYLPPGDPVGVLALTTITNPASKVVFDSSQSNNGPVWFLFSGTCFSEKRDFMKNCCPVQ
jgi:hypothetical protein